MKTIAVAYFVLVGILMGSATALVSTEVLFCSQKTSPSWCEPIDKITDAFAGY
ncbi:hypothetical protein [Nostoc sp. UHCC 0252]|uniref:hypothetical protein n=1 Tax=Nostoc sp. UHCC 0252 TaxID=3110241 RepID=UPI002B1F2AE1|nr:hypothetical protein [Nostoc sp. UHCC 0252]MEA5606259.1 hypothetical protein [Nostoc sp. UHCC 0252]